MSPSQAELTSADILSAYLEDELRTLAAEELRTLRVIFDSASSEKTRNSAICHLEDIRARRPKVLKAYEIDGLALEGKSEKRLRQERAIAAGRQRAAAGDREQRLMAELRHIVRACHVVKRRIPRSRAKCSPARRTSGSRRNTADSDPGGGSGDGDGDHRVGRRRPRPSVKEGR